MKIKVTGDLGGFQKKIHQMAQVAANPEYTFEEIFTPEFMAAHTKCATIEDFLKDGGFPVGSQEEFDRIPVAGLDDYVKRVTSFESWEAMKAKAVIIKAGF
jgi:hypothetical protein